MHPLLLSVWLASITSIITITATQRYPIIPKPVSIVALDGSFTINPSTRILINSIDKEAKELAAFIADFFVGPLGTSLPIGKTNNVPAFGALSLIIDSTSGIEPEGYVLAPRKGLSV